MKIICTSPSFAKYDTTPIDTLKQHGFELVTLPADATPEALAPHLPEAVAMIVAFTEVNEALLAQTPQLKIVCKHGVGVDNIDLDATRARHLRYQRTGRQQARRRRLRLCADPQRRAPADAGGHGNARGRLAAYLRHRRLWQNAGHCRPGQYWQAGGAARERLQHARYRL